MKTHSIQNRDITIPESWDDVSFSQYITYLKKIKPLAFTPSRLRFMDAVNGEGGQEIFDTEPDLLNDLCFIHDGPPKLTDPKTIELGIITLEIKLPIYFLSGEQMEDFNRLAVDMVSMDDLQRIEQAPKFCSIYCHGLMNGEYRKKGNLSLVEKIAGAPVTQVMNLYMHLMLHMTGVNYTAMQRAKIKQNLNLSLN